MVGQNQVLVTAVLGLAVLLAVLAFVYLSNSGTRKSQSQPKFIIVGPSYSGKTTLFKKWTSGEDVTTVTSQQANRATIELPFGSGDKEFGLVDLPGHAKLEYLTLAELDASIKNSLRGIIFLVDASSAQAGISQAAAMLYHILQRTEKNDSGIDVLVAANKSDIFNVVSAARLKIMLEAEINELREAKSHSVGEVKDAGADEDDDEGAWIGLEGKFEFSQLSGSVDVLDGSVKAGSTKKWESWVDERA